MGLKIKNLISMDDLSREETDLILENADSMKEIVLRKNKKLPTLRGFSMVNLFYEPSTRTRVSFEYAGKYLGADTSNISASSSSVAKGENLIDTGKTIEAMGINMIVMRHPMAGACNLLAKNLNSRIINAGDGFHEHPTQALLDMFTIKEHKGKIEGLKIAIIGDINHSRVARSNIIGLTKMGAKVALGGPPTLLNQDLFSLMGVECHYRLEGALTDADVVMVLRIQKERQNKVLIPSLREYTRLFGITKEKFNLAKEDAILMHPGPANKGVELSEEVAKSSRSLIDNQVTNGVAVRMALLYLLSGGEQNSETA